jgi:hypothetical protein
MRPLRSRLLSRPVWIGAFVVVVLILLGCMSSVTREEPVTTVQSVGTPPEPFQEVNRAGWYESLPPGDGLLEQEGSVNIPAHAYLDVYYPIPYISPPNLNVRCSWNDCLVVGQKPDHFRLHNPESSARHVDWKVKGVKVQMKPLVVTPAKASQPAPTNELPPEPIPVSVKEK